MHAQHQSANSQSDQVALAHLLLEANKTYGESNDPANRYLQRLKARQACRGLLTQLLTMDVANAPAMGLLGRVEMDDGNLERAQVLFNASLEQNPDQPQQYCNLGYWAMATERPALAEHYFQQALTLDRQSAAAFCGVAHAKRAQGQFDVAYLHYRKLLETGLEWPSIFTGMVTCAEHLSVSNADQSLARDAIVLLSRDELPHQQLGRFVAAIIRQQYDLDNPRAEVFLQAACEDELLILALEKTLMPDAAVEELVTLLRRAITVEVAASAELREELHRLTLALALYADRTGYALLMDEDEDHLVRTLNHSIKAQFTMGEPLADIAGSMMVSALYGALFHQKFAVDIGNWALPDWPLGLQPLLAASYYNRATEEAIKQNFEEKQQELALERADVPQAWPSWSQLAYRSAGSLRTVMEKNLKLPVEELPGTLRMMICGAESGQRALELAWYLEDVEIVAVDESLANVAKASRRADEMGLENIVFWPWSIARRFVADGHQVNWIEVGRLPSEQMTELSLAELINTATAAGGVAHLHTAVAEQTRGDLHIRHLIQRHKLQPTQNHLRRLRRMALNNRQDGLWEALLTESDFYGLGGCRDRWFSPQDTGQLQRVLALMNNDLDWKLIKAQDSEGQTLAREPVKQQLREEATGGQVQSLIGQGLSVYFQKRR